MTWTGNVKKCHIDLESYGLEFYQIKIESLRLDFLRQKHFWHGWTQLSDDEVLKQIPDKESREKTSSKNPEKKEHHQITNSSTNPEKKNIIKHRKFIKPKTQRRKTFAWSFVATASVTFGLGRFGFVDFGTWRTIDVKKNRKNDLMMKNRGTIWWRTETKSFYVACASNVGNGTEEQLGLWLMLTCF